MLCFGHFAGLEHQQHNIAFAVSSFPFYPRLWERFWRQSDVRGCCNVVFWPRDKNTIFEGKMAQLWRLVKSLLLTPDVSNFGIAYSTRYILKLNKNKFHFIGTLKEHICRVFHTLYTKTLEHRRKQQSVILFSVIHSWKLQQWHRLCSKAINKMRVNIWGLYEVKTCVSESRLVLVLFCKISKLID